jgi:molybdopterin molybdotransferase
LRIETAAMISESDALQRILAEVTPLPSRRVALSAAQHAFAMRPVHALVPLPGFDNSAMDGYAVRAEDTRTQEPLRVSGAIPAGGSAAQNLEPHCAIRIFTGALMPQGADAVIMQEDVSTLNEGRQIICTEPVERGENVRVLGCDLCLGQKILETGDRLTSARLAVLASQGLAQTDVAETPRVAIVTTGDELMSPGQTLQAGMLFNSNATLLESLVRDHCPSAQITTRHLPDNLRLTTDALRELSANHDFVVLAGGVSVGEHDHVKPALQALRIRAEFWRVQVKPGKPFLFAKTGSDERACHVFGLPGNPVSVFVTFQLFVRPALLKLAGAGDAALSFVEARANAVSPMRNPGDRPHYVRGRYESGKFRPLGMQQSHALYGLSQSNALVRMAPGQEVAEGGEVMALLC